MVRQWQIICFGWVDMSSLYCHEYLWYWFLVFGHKTSSKDYSYDGIMTAEVISIKHNHPQRYRTNIKIIGPFFQFWDGKELKISFKKEIEWKWKLMQSICNPWKISCVKINLISNIKNKTIMVDVFQYGLTQLDSCYGISIWSY